MGKAWGHTQPAVPAGGFFLLYKANGFFGLFFSFVLFLSFGVGEAVGMPSAVFSLIVEFDAFEARK